jgi:hypothetical protein
MDLSGAPRDSKVTCSGYVGGVLELVVNNDDLFSDPFIIKILRDDEKNVLIARLSYLNVKEGRSGLGSRIFTCVARAASRLQFDRFEANALAGGEHKTRSGQPWTGAVFAAKLGFDGTLPSDLAERLPSAWASVRGLRELLAQPQGEAWWSKNALPLKATFDVSPNSPGMETLRTYTKRKGIRIFQCFTPPSFK